MKSRAPIGRRPIRIARHDSSGQKIKDVADRPFSGGGFGNREMRLDLVPVSPAFLRLDQVTGRGEVGHDPVGSTLRDAQGLRNVANTDLWIIGDAEQSLSVIGQEVPRCCHNICT